jgi:hypothetical protein
MTKINLKNRIKTWFCDNLWVVSTQLTTFVSYQARNLQGKSVSYQHIFTLHGLVGFG